MSIYLPALNSHLRATCCKTTFAGADASPGKTPSRSRANAEALISADAAGEELEMQIGLFFGDFKKKKGRLTLWPAGTTLQLLLRTLSLE